MRLFDFFCLLYYFSHFVTGLCDAGNVICEDWNFSKEQTINAYASFLTSFFNMLWNQYSIVFFNIFYTKYITYPDIVKIARIISFRSLHCCLRNAYSLKSVGRLAVIWMNGCVSLSTLMWEHSISELLSTFCWACKRKLDIVTCTLTFTCFLFRETQTYEVSSTLCRRQILLCINIRGKLPCVLRRCTCRSHSL